MIALLAALMLAPAAAADSVITQPDWIRKPNAEQLSDFYPKAAAAFDRAGRVTLDCKVRSDGTLEACRVADESPPGEGFGDAALRMTGIFQMKPFTLDGRAVSGARIYIPINFLPQSGRLDPLSGALRCYGRAAALAETNPANPDAWFAARFWAVQSMSAAAAAHRPPSALENDLSSARHRAAGADARQTKYEWGECDQAMKSALAKAK